MKQNKLVSRKQRNICKILNYTDNLLILGSTIITCVPISASVLLVDIPVGIASSTAKIKN